MTPVQQREVSEADSASVEIRFRGQKIIILRRAEQFGQSSLAQSASGVARLTQNCPSGTHHGGCNKLSFGLWLPRSYFGKILRGTGQSSCRLVPRLQLTNVPPWLFVEVFAHDI
jgi:hypothetical protein